MSDASSPPLVVAITGASGARYASRLLEVLCASGSAVELVFSQSALDVIRTELSVDIDPRSFAPATFGLPRAARIRCHNIADFTAGIASGSYRTGGMVIVPCSMSTLAAIAHGITTNLISRAADVHLKERRKLILVPRETPLSLAHIENMASATRAGAIVLPAMPGWYHQPKKLDDLVDFVVARICDQLGVAHDLGRRWGDEPGGLE